MFILLENTGSEDPVYVKREIASPVPTESSAFSSEFNSKSDVCQKLQIDRQILYFLNFR